jgi:hypothetical protein
MLIVMRHQLFMQMGWSYFFLKIPANFSRPGNAMVYSLLLMVSSIETPSPFSSDCWTVSIFSRILQVSPPCLLASKLRDVAEWCLRRTLMLPVVAAQQCVELLIIGDYGTRDGNQAMW